MINFPTTIYIAAKSLKEFSYIKKRIKQKNIQIGYLPVLTKEEGYWFSAFSKTSGVKRIIEELRNSKGISGSQKILRNRKAISGTPKIPKEFLSVSEKFSRELKQNKERLIVLWGAEQPILRKRLFITNLFSIFRNKKLISDFFKNASKYNIKIVTAEYPIRVFDCQFNLFVIRRADKDKMINMVYGSQLKSGKYFENQRFSSFNDEQVGRDLVKKNGDKGVAIFRLGRRNKEYQGVIENFLK